MVKDRRVENTAMLGLVCKKYLKHVYRFIPHTMLLPPYISSLKVQGFGLFVRNAVFFFLNEIQSANLDSKVFTTVNSTDL